MAGFDSSEQGVFPQTDWELVEQAKSAGEETQEQALHAIIDLYWRPVFLFLRAKGRNADTAGELCQEFFVRLLEKNWVEKADPRRGKFRTLMLTVLTRFMADQSDGRISHQQRFERWTRRMSELAADESEPFHVPVHATPEMIFDHHWALAIVADVRNEVRLACEQCQMHEWFVMFERCLPFQGEQSLSQAQAAREYGLTRDQVRYRLQAIKSRYREAIMRKLKLADVAGAELDEEVDDLLAALQLA